MPAADHELSRWVCRKVAGSVLWIRQDRRAASKRHAPTQFSPGFPLCILLWVVSGAAADVLQTKEWDVWRTFAVSACDRHSSFDGGAFRLRFALGFPGVSIRRLISSEQRAPARYVDSRVKRSLLTVNHRSIADQNVLLSRYFTTERENYLPFLPGTLGKTPHCGSSTKKTCYRFSSELLSFHGICIQSLGQSSMWQCNIHYLWQCRYCMPQIIIKVFQVSFWLYISCIYLKYILV